MLDVRLQLHVTDVLRLADSEPGHEPGHEPRHEHGRAELSYGTCDLIVASGFADLLPPCQLAALLTRLAPGGLAYLPITFTGTTRLDPPSSGDGDTPR